MKPLDVVFAARMEAMRLARNAVRQELKAQGVKLSYYKASELYELAKHWYCHHHDQLFDVALRQVLADGLRANLSKSVQRANARSCKGFCCANLGCKMIIGYARVSTDGQELDAQHASLKAAGAEKVFAEKESGAKTDRKALAKALASLGAGDVLLVTRLDRLARSTRDLLNVLDAVGKAGAGFRSLADPMIDTTSPHGKLILAVLAALAEFETMIGRKRRSEASPSEWGPLRTEASADQAPSPRGPCSSRSWQDDD